MRIFGYLLSILGGGSFILFTLFIFSTGMDMANLQDPTSYTRALPGMVITDLIMLAMAILGIKLIRADRSSRLGLTKADSMKSESSFAALPPQPQAIISGSNVPTLANSGLSILTSGKVKDFNFGSKRPKFAILDLETTGFSDWDKVLEYGLILTDENFNVEAEYSSLVYTDNRVENIWVHGIDKDMLEEAPLQDDAINHLLHLLAGRILIAHNVRFDRRFLVNHVQKINPLFELHGSDQDLDTMQIGFELVGAKGLGEIAKRMGIEYDAHSALEDARMVLAVLQKAQQLNSRSLASSIKSATPWPSLAKEYNPIIELPRPDVEERSRKRREWLTKVHWDSGLKDKTLEDYIQAISSYCLNFDLSRDEKMAASTLIEQAGLSYKSVMKVHESVLHQLASIEFPSGSLDKRTALLEVLAENLGFQLRPGAFGANGSNQLFIQGMKIALAGRFAQYETQAQKKEHLRAKGFEIASSVKDADVLLVRFKDNSASAVKQAIALGIPVLDEFSFRVYLGD